MIKAVIDPGALISGLLTPDGPPGMILRRLWGGHFELVVSPMLLAELPGVLARSKFRRYVDEGDIGRFVERIRTGAVMFDDPPVEHGVTPDPSDDYLMSLAVASGSAVLVTGDKQLRALELVDLPILTPCIFLDALDAR